MKSNRQYRSGTLEKGLDVLEALERSPEPLRIHDVVSATQLDRAAVFRLLCTLEDRGYIERLDDKRYRSKLRKRMPRVVYIAPLSGNSFRDEVTAGIQRAAEGSGLELEFLDCGDAELPQAQVERTIASGAEAIILFQRRGSLAHIIADRFLEAKIPVISVETPIAGAIYFGGNSYRAGVLAGEALGRFAKTKWKGRFDRLALLESSLSAAENMARLTGAIEGAEKILGSIPTDKILHVDGLASREGSQAACRKMLATLAKNNRVLISCFNDISAIGALEAVKEAGRERSTAIVGQNGTEESRRELARSSSALIASVGYFPEKYGEMLIKLASDVVSHRKTPLALYAEHVLLHHANLKKYYPAST